jgi:adenosylcobinamide kinase/adenosylcobinamide-phosphate guanylyltransferase
MILLSIPFRRVLCALCAFAVQSVCQEACVGRLVLVLGGARSGKSAFAERLARTEGGDRVLYIATALVNDAEMAERVARHRAQRPAAWETMELAHRVGETLLVRADLPPVLLLDCLTLLLSTPAMNSDVSTETIEAHATAEVDGLLRLADTHAGTLIVVSNEVGMGMVPPYPMGRAYRDALGRANQHLAARADAAYLLIAGIPLDLAKLRAAYPPVPPP